MGKRSRETSFSPSADSESEDEEEDTIDDCRLMKISALEAGEDSAPQSVMQCSLPPHAQSLHFSSINAFEVHYLKDHSNRCSSCTKNFPSAHFLSLHIDEKHNPLRAELESKGEKTYRCLVEDCEKLCSTPQKRKLHLIGKHLFPKSYNFRVIEYGIDKRTSMLVEKPQRRRVSTTSAPADNVIRHRRSSSQHNNPGTMADNREVPVATKRTDTESRVNSTTNTSSITSSNPQNTTSDPLGELTDSIAALRFLPPSVRRQQVKKAP